MTKQSQTDVRSISPCLTFANRAEDAVNFYVSVFKRSKVVSVLRSESDGPVPKGQLLHATFELNGREYTAFDGGPHFSFSQGFSLVATCDSQEELDDVWAKLSAGGKEGPCGWLTDQFGVSWQVVPSVLGDMMSNPNGGNSRNVMQALVKMSKLDIKTLENAYRS